MTTETITIRVDARAAEAFRQATDEQRRKIEALLSLRLLDVVQINEPLEYLLQRMSTNAQQKGLTPEILEDLLNDQE